MARRAYSYTRFSSLAQAGGDSRRRQTDAARRWCEAHDAQLVEDFSDLGVSAFRGKNATEGALSVFMRLAESGKIPAGSILLVESLDRITRSEITSAVTLFLRIISTGLTVVTLTDGQIYDSQGVNADPAKIIISVTILMRAHEESATKSKRLSAAWEQKRRNASTDRPLSKNGPSWLIRSGGKWDIIEDRASVIRRIFSLMSEGAGVHAIARRLTQEGHPTPRGKGHWTDPTVKSILNRRSVLGDLVVKGGKIIEGYYPQIVPPSLWASAHRVFRAHSAARGVFPGRQCVNIFRGLIYDATGERLQAFSGTGRGSGKSYHYLRTASQRFTRDKTPSWPFQEFKLLFLALVQQASLAEPVDSGDGAAVRIATQIEGVQAQEANLVRVLASGYHEAVEKELRLLADRRKELESLLIGAQAGAPNRSLMGTEIDWTDDGALAENIRATVRRIVVDRVARCFEVELLTGEVLSYSEDGGKSRFEETGRKITMFPPKGARIA